MRSVGRVSSLTWFSVSRSARVEWTRSSTIVNLLPYCFRNSTAAEMSCGARVEIRFGAGAGAGVGVGLRAPWSLRHLWSQIKRHLQGLAWTQGSVITIE